MKSPVVVVGPELGKGAENYCNVVEGIFGWDGYPSYERSEDPNAPQYVVKIQRLVRGAWQLNTEPFRKQCIKVLMDARRRHIPTAIIKNPTLVYSDGVENPNPLGYVPDMVQFSPRVKGFEKLNLGYQHFADEGIRKQLLALAEEAESITKEHKIGLDPYGGEIVADFMDGVKEEIFLIIDKLSPHFTPEFIKEIIRSRLVGVKGQMRNVLVGQETVILHPESEVFFPEYVKAGLTTILGPKEITISDIGGHVMNKVLIRDRNLGTGFPRVINTLKRRPVQAITDPMQGLTWGTYMELLLRADPSLAGRSKLPFRGREDGFVDQVSRSTYNAISSLAVDFMEDRFRRHEEYLALHESQA